MLYLQGTRASKNKPSFLDGYLFILREWRNMGYLLCMIIVLKEIYITFLIFKMKFIDEMCNKIVSPSKIRYATHDLGKPSDIQEATIFNQESVLILQSSIIRDAVYKEVYIKVISTLKAREYVYSIFTVWMALACKVHYSAI